MYKDLENSMVIDSLWRYREQLPKSFGECAGCYEDIVAGESYYEIRSNGEIIMVHQEAECCRNYVAEMSWCRTAGGDDD